MVVKVEKQTVSHVWGDKRFPGRRDKECENGGVKNDSKVSTWATRMGLI